MGVIRVVLTDLDGVIRRWPASQFQSVEDAYGLERGSLSRAAFDKPLLTDAITGAITDAQWRKQIARLLGSQTDPATAASAVAAWSTSPGEVDAFDFIINSSAIGCAKPSPSAAKAISGADASTNTRYDAAVALAKRSSLSMIVRKTWMPRSTSDSMATSSNTLPRRTHPGTSVARMRPDPRRKPSARLTSLRVLPGKLG